MNSISFSIVTISYNQLKYLKACVESIACQLISGDQYFIQDAFSTDGSQEYLRDFIANYKGPGRIEFSSELDNGPADGLNRAFAKCTADYGVYINSDDLLVPNALENARSLLQANANIDLVFFSGYIVDELKNKCYSIKQFIPGPRSYALGASHFLQQSLVFKSSIFKKVKGFNEKNKSCWDREILVDFLRLEPSFIYSDIHFGIFRIQPNSITANKNLEAKYRYEVEKIAKKSGYVYFNYFIERQILLIRFRIVKLLGRKRCITPVSCGSISWKVCTDTADVSDIV